MSPWEFQNAVKGWEEERRDRLEFDRAMAFYSVRVHMKPTASLKPTDMYRFPWDNQSISSGKARILTEDEAQQTKDRLRKTLKLKQ